MFDLKNFNSFKMPFSAGRILKLSSVENVSVSMPEIAGEERLILGGGSNLVILNPIFEGVVIRPEIKTWLSKIQGTQVLLEIGAGHLWHEVVISTLKEGWYGLENLALIPGWVGAAPFQNIGAYGVEFKDFCESVVLYDFDESAVVELNSDQMKFGYRHSILKDNPGRFMVLSVRLLLSTIPKPIVDYGAVQEGIAAFNGSKDRPEDVAKAVMAIRRTKLPDPEVFPNVGSFFKNPVVRQEVAVRVSKSHPQIPSYLETGGVKLAAGWMIDQLGLKGFSVGQFGVHKDQALVLTHAGNGDADDLRTLIRTIRVAVKDEFGVSLQIEPTLLGRL